MYANGLFFTRVLRLISCICSIAVNEIQCNSTELVETTQSSVASSTQTETEKSTTKSQAEITAQQEKQVASNEDENAEKPMAITSE